MHSVRLNNWDNNGILVQIHNFILTNKLHSLGAYNYAIKSEFSELLFQS